MDDIHQNGSKWIDHSGIETKPETLLTPVTPDKMQVWKVSRKVTTPNFDNPECLKKLEDSETEEKKESPETQASLFD